MKIGPLIVIRNKRLRVTQILFRRGDWNATGRSILGWRVQALIATDGRFVGLMVRL